MEKCCPVANLEGGGGWKQSRIPAMPLADLHIKFPIRKNPNPIKSWSRSRRLAYEHNPHSPGLVLH